MFLPAVIANGVGVINFVAGAIGVIGFGQDQVKSDPNNVNIRIRAGLSGARDIEGRNTKLDSPDGDKPYIQVYDYTGASAAAAGGEHTGECESGEVCDITLDTSKQVHKIKVLAGPNAVCIATLGYSSTSDKSFGMVGDVWDLCGRPWAWSGVKVGNNDVQVKCGWIDMDNQVEKVGNRWRNPQGFELDIRKFPSSTPAGSQATAESDDIEKFIKMDRKKAQKEICSHIRFIDGLTANKNHWYKRVRSGAVDRPSRGEMRGMVRRDQLAKRRLGMNELVIAPKMSFGTAKELCDSLHSTGPDYANIEEGLFCSIETKTLYPICGAEEATGDALCFDVEKEALVHGRSAALVPRQETYKKVMKW